MAKFQDREDILEELCAPVSQGPLLNVFGETGIGKSRLLKEAVLHLQKEAQPLLILEVKFEALVDAEDRQTALLEALIGQARGYISGFRDNREQLANTIVAEFSKVSEHTPIYLFFDTTEALQEDQAFWDWLHEHLAEPLVVAGKVKQIYAGRIPVRWLRFELRRVVKLLSLGPIAPHDASRALIQEVLLQKNRALEDSDTLPKLIDLVSEFSFGHPRLSEKLAEYIAQHWPSAYSAEEYRKVLCKEVIKPFIDHSLFGDLDPLWCKILWLASVLDWFDPAILKQYLEQLMPEVKDKPDYYFIREVAQLRTHHTVVWREQRGDRLHGLIQDIVRQCLKTMNPEQYQVACRAAANVFASIATEFSDEEDYARQFSDAADMYRQRARA